MKIDIIGNYIRLVGKEGYIVPINKIDNFYIDVENRGIYGEEFSARVIRDLPGLKIINISHEEWNNGKVTFTKARVIILNEVEFKILQVSWKDRDEEEEEVANTIIEEWEVMTNEYIMSSLF